MLLCFRRLSPSLLTCRTSVVHPDLQAAFHDSDDVFGDGVSVFEGVPVTVAVLHDKTATRFPSASFLFSPDPVILRVSTTAALLGYVLHTISNLHF